MRAVVLFAVIVFLIPRAEAQDQSVRAAARAQSVAKFASPASHRGYKPKISLQAALKIAEDFVADERIDVSGGWLNEARFTLYGGKTKPDSEKEPCWFFQWILRERPHWCANRSCGVYGRQGHEITDHVASSSQFVFPTVEKSPQHSLRVLAVPSGQ